MDVEPRVRIELDVFSGRENPSWELSREDAREIIALLRSKNERAAQPHPLKGLGFRGFVITVKRDEHEERYLASGPVIELGRQQYLDPESKIERFIVATMPAKLRNEFSDVLPP